MSETLRDLVVSLSLNSDNFTRNIKSVNKHIQQAESEFRLAAAGVEGFEKSTTGLAAKLGTLKQKLDLQKVAVDQYEKALTQANDKLTECKTRQQDYAAKLTAAKQKQAELKEEVDKATEKYEAFKEMLGETDSAVIEDKAHMDDLKAQYAAASDEVKKLEGQQTALKKSTQNASDAVAQASINLNNAKAAAKELAREVTTLSSAWTKAGMVMESFGVKLTKEGAAIAGAGKTLTTAFTTPIVALGAASVKASIDFESSFAGVRKTVDATEAEFAELADASKKMSTQIATSTSEINGVMATGGQLGIANNYLSGFTRTMIDLGNSCEDLDANTAATQLAKFANIMGTDQSKFQNMGSTVVALGNNFATTEKPIVEMAMRLAGAGKQVGLTEAQVLGFATALSSVGIEAQMGGSAFSKALIKMEVAAQTGGQALTDFATVSGMTEDAFKRLFETDPAAAFQSFIVGLSKMDDEGESAIVTLNDIGISEIRLRDTLLRATNATELFSRAQETATNAWAKNTALTEEASKRYATTESKLKNLKNTAILFGQQIGDDLNPTIQNLTDGATDLLNKFMELDEAQRMQIIRFAAVAAGAGPVLSVLGKLTTGVGKGFTALGKFSTAVGKAGGGFKGFMSVVSSSPAAWFAVATAVAVGTAALIDYASGARKAREALEGMKKTAESWKNTAAETFYGKSEGLSAFGLSESDFQHNTEADKKAAQEWVDGVIAVWSDGKKETDAIVSEWTNSFKALTSDTRSALEEMQINAEIAGNSALSDTIASDIAQLDAMDAEIEALLKKRQSRRFTKKDKIRLQELIDNREAIEVKYRLTEMDVDGFDAIAQKLEAAVARAQATGKTDADISVYEDAVVAAAEGMAAVNKELDAQYDAEYANIQLMDDELEKKKALALLNQQYNADRTAAANEYAALLQGIVMPVWNQQDVQKAKEDVQNLYDLLGKYSTVGEDEKPAILEQMNQLTAGMDEGALTEYIALLTQIQSLLDSGMSESEVAGMFPEEIDFSNALKQIAEIQQFAANRSATLSSLSAMFGEALPEEVLKIATDLDMTGAQARWDEFAANPGAITTQAVVESYTEAENARLLQPTVDAWIAKYTEIPEGADVSALTPTGLLAYVTAYAESTTGADVSGLTPENLTAIVSGYRELASGTDVSALTPADITAYVSRYLEKQGVDTTGLTPGNITAAVMAYEEITGGASTAALNPTNLAAMVVKYLQADHIDVSALSEPQVDAIVSAYAEAVNCDKSSLKAEVIAQITAYEDAQGVTKPTIIPVKLAITGYDLAAYNEFVSNNPVEITGRVRLGEVYENPLDVLSADNVEFYDMEGKQIPVELVPKEQITADTLFLYDSDGTMHVLITPEVQGTTESVEKAATLLDTMAHQGSIGSKLFGDDTLTDIQRLNEYLVGIDNEMNSILNIGGWMNGWDKKAAADTISSYLDMTEIGNIQAFVQEAVTALNNGEQLSEDVITKLQAIQQLAELMNSIGVGENILAGIAEGMTEGGMDTDAETVAANIEAALNAALQIHSPSQRVKPVGENVSAGVGEGMSGYSFDGDAEAMASAVQAAVESAFPENMFASVGTSAAQGLVKAMTSYPMAGAASSIAASARTALGSNLNSGSLRSIGVNAMAGLRAGINAGRSGVISAMRSAARAAVNAAKAELKIHSPSRVFEDEVGVMAMRGWGKGVLKESKEQAKTIRNATRFLTGEAKSGSVAPQSFDNRRTYNTNSTVSFAGSNFYVRDSQDAYALAVEIASLTRRRQRGKGLRMA